jgi:tRNA G18 (ribose-2'-O)-methylase SpoU
VALHPLRIARVAALDDPRLDDYRDIRDDRLRARGNAFAVESREVVRQCLRERRFRLRSVLLTELALETLRDVLDDATAVYVGDQALIRDVVGFNFHRGCMGIAERGTPLALADVLARTPRTIVVCERLSNPDNVGGVFRNAMAFGADAVVLSPGSADPLYRKVVRVSIGGSVRVPFVETAEWPGTLARLRAAGFTVLALTTRDGVDVGTIAPPARLALLLGSEGDGLTDAALAHTDVRATIPMAAGVDSLNASVACAIALHRFADPRYISGRGRTRA